MRDLIDKIDAKVITSVGGIILAGFLAFTLYKITTNEFPHLEAAIRETSKVQAEIQQQTNDVIRDITKVVEGNTQVLRNLDIKISTLR